MAGTIVADTLQDGAGNSTAMDNAIYGSAKAWVNFGYVSSAITVRASYNVSSVTRNGAGDYTVNFTNAFADANYTISGSGSTPGTTNNCLIAPYTTSPQTTSCRIGTYNFGSFSDSTYASVVINR